MWVVGVLAMGRNGNFVEISIFWNPIETKITEWVEIQWKDLFLVWKRLKTRVLTTQTIQEKSKS